MKSNYTSKAVIGMPNISSESIPLNVLKKDAKKVPFNLVYLPPLLLSFFKSDLTVNHILPTTTTLLHNLCHLNMCLRPIISGFWSYGYDTSNYTISRPFTKKKYNKLIDKSFAVVNDALFNALKIFKFINNTIISWQTNSNQSLV